MARLDRSAAGRRLSRGFTLVEILVVLIIMGVLVAIGLPKYMKTVETSRAEDAQAMVKLIGQAHRMYALDNNNTFLGAGQSSGALSSSHPLVSAKYIAATDFGDMPYVYYTCPGGACCGGCSPSAAAAACGQRKTPAPSLANGWGYVVGQDNTMCKLTASTPDPL